MRRTEMSGQSAAAEQVASASAAPGHSDASAAIGSEAPRHVTQTSTVVRSIDSVSTRVAPAKDHIGVRYQRVRYAREPRRSRPSPRHPARHWTFDVDGRSPGSRVVASCRLPDRPAQDDQWLQASARRLQLRGQPWVCTGGSYRGPYHIPSSLSQSREAIDLSSTQSRARVVNNSLMPYPDRVVRCSAARCAQRVKREAGASAACAALHSGTAPATVSKRQANRIEPLRVQRGKAIRRHGRLRFVRLQVRRPA
jgi:hypothetical protein